MKRRFLTAAMLAATVLYAQAPAEVEITDEPHHHFRFENEYVRVFNVELAPQESTLMHRHRHDYVFVTLGATEVSNEVKDKLPVNLKLQDGETRFLPGGSAHAARDLASTPFRNVTIEFLQDEQAHSSPPPKWDDDRALQVFPGGTQEILFVKDGVRVSEIELQPGAMIPSHHHKGPHLLVAITDLGVRSDVKDQGPRPGHFKSGDVKWLPGGYTRHPNQHRQTGRQVRNSGIPNSFCSPGPPARERPGHYPALTRKPIAVPVLFNPLKLGSGPWIILRNLGNPFRTGFCRTDSIFPRQTTFSGSQDAAPPSPQESKHPLAQSKFTWYKQSRREQCVASRAKLCNSRRVSGI